MLAKDYIMQELDTVLHRYAALDAHKTFKSNFLKMLNRYLIHSGAALFFIV